MLRTLGLYLHGLLFDCGCLPLYGLVKLTDLLGVLVPLALDLCDLLLAGFLLLLLSCVNLTAKLADMLLVVFLLTLGLCGSVAGILQLADLVVKPSSQFCGLLFGGLAELLKLFLEVTDHLSALVQLRTQLVSFCITLTLDSSNLRLVVFV